MDKTIIINNFSKSAQRYDEYAGIQRFAANRLIEEVPKNGFKQILEIGCGTGIYTRLLKARFGSSRIRAVDISERMIRVARENIRAENVEFEIGDAEEISLEEGYDLITSNSAIQWFESIESALQRYSNVLNKGAWLVFSSFGPLTFRELAAALKDAGRDREFFVASRNFLDQAELRRLLRKFLDKVSVEEIITQKEYPSLKGLLENIKHTGARGCITGRGYIWSQRLLKAVEDAYMNNNGCITATYQIFLCKAAR
ncbi:MAG: malonyl-ACP O-methyltransferase BioC [Candidatus Omnitrophota bacterium]|nr:malonyl-ACP O-methyltransferase BioC [Candidatus Omnitrophota bacterium]